MRHLMFHSARDKKSALETLWSSRGDTEEAFEDLLRALRSEQIEKRRHAARLLGRLGDPQAIPPLIEALQDPNDRVRGEVARSLGDLQPSTKSVIEVLNSSLRDRSAWVRQCAAYALGQLGEQALPALASLRKAIRDPKIRVSTMAAEALGQIRSPESVQILIQALQFGVHALKKKAAIALGQLNIHAQPAIPHLIEHLDYSASMTFWVDIAHSLLRIGLNDKDKQEACHKLLQFFDEDSTHFDEGIQLSWVREHAVDALGYLGTEDAIPPLLSLIQPLQQEGPLHEKVLRALRRLGPIATPAIPLLTSQHNHPWLEKDISQTLASIGEDALPSLQVFLSSNNIAKQKFALRVLSQMTHVELDIEQFIIPYLAFPALHVRALEALMRHGTTGCEAHLTPFFQHEDPTLQWMAIRAQGRWKTPPALHITLLKQAQWHPQERIRLEAHLTLQKLNIPHTLDTKLTLTLLDRCTQQLLQNEHHLQEVVDDMLCVAQQLPTSIEHWILSHTEEFQHESMLHKLERRWNRIDGILRSPPSDLPTTLLPSLQQIVHAIRQTQDRILHKQLLDRWQDDLEQPLFLH
ncbi:MAG: hypothetical protein CL920_15295 [Deltaproteobacteria bacterium]|nr:hypothetical protein [Deltaproteobacteria bacterium]